MEVTLGESVWGPETEEKVKKVVADAHFTSANTFMSFSFDGEKRTRLENIGIPIKRVRDLQFIPPVSKP